MTAESKVAPVRIKVWDLPTRLFHWLLVGLVALALITGFVAPEWWMGLHSAAGYGVVALMLFRLVWGFFGSEHARFASFAKAPRYLGAYLAGLALLRPPHYVGHNPLGVLMIFALAALLLGLTATGLLVLGGEEKQGPLAGVLSYATGNAAKAWHGALAWVLIGLIGGHVLGVLGESLLTRQNLVAAMVTGWKRAHLCRHAAPPQAARPIAAAIATAAFAGLLAALVLSLGALTPTGYRALDANAAYEKECGACHLAFHPSLLPVESWRRVMTGLAEHFGEDASLDAVATREIEAWLSANAAETWDTEAANRFRVVDAAKPTRITETPYWRRKHEEVDASVFARRGIRSKANCLACHRDAATGRFDDQEIDIPKE